MTAKQRTAKSSKREGKGRSPRVSEVNQMLTEDSLQFVNIMKAVLPPRLASLLRHSLAGLSDDLQEFVCDNVMTYLSSHKMLKSGEEHVDQRLGLLLLELMNEPDIVYPPF